MRKANWYIYGVETKVLQSPAVVDVNCVDDFSSRTAIGVPQVKAMLPDVPTGLFRYRTVKKIKNGLGDSVYQLICKRVS